MKFVIQPNQLIITLEGFERLWALKHRLHIPAHAIEDITYEPQTLPMQSLRRYWRIPGTAIPYFFLAGTFRKHGSREFWYLRMRQPGVMTIALKTGSFTYDYIRITCQATLAQEVADWWRQYRFESAAA